jgi:hypothetical protein
MEAGAAGVLYAAENLLEGAVALVKGITHPTLPIIANLARISSVPLPRSYHTVSVVKGRAYIFGGETESGKIADNDMHIVILPSSGVLEADYTKYPARAANGLDDVPNSRKGHTATVGKYSRYNVTTLLLTYYRYVKPQIPLGWCFGTRCYLSSVSF